MSTISLALIFLAPFILTAVYLIIKETQDPLRDYHERYRRNLIRRRSSTLRVGDDSVFGKAKKWAIGLYIFATFILLVIGAKVSTLILLALVLSIFVYWDNGTIKRKSKNVMELSEAEFPSVIELFTILVSAGESPATAIEKIAKSARGELAIEFGRALSSMKNGANLIQSLESMANGATSVTVRRFCHTLILAVERGTSLSEVLQRQVQEVRQQNHASLLTAAGKAEIALMIPVIFLILPVSVLFALWPSYVSLGQSVGY